MAVSLRTTAQNRAMWGSVQALAQATGGSRKDAEVALRAICQEVAGHEHTSRLTRPQADQVLERLRARVAAETKNRPRPAAKAGGGGGRKRAEQPITDRQQQVIQALYIQIGWPDRRRQMTFCQRQCKCAWPQTQAHADKLIEPLKAMALRHTDPADAYQRAQALVGHPGLDAWQRGFIPDLCGQFAGAADIGAVLTPHKLLKLVEAEVAAKAAR